MIPLSQQKLKLKIDSKHFLVLYLHGYCQRRAARVHFSLFINLFQSQHHQKSDGRTAETMPALRATADAVTAACNALEPVFMHTHAKSRTSELKIMAGFFSIKFIFYSLEKNNGIKTSLEIKEFYFHSDTKCTLNKRTFQFPIDVKYRNICI